MTTLVSTNAMSKPKRIAIVLAASIGADSGASPSASKGARTQRYLVAVGRRDGDAGAGSMTGDDSVAVDGVTSARAGTAPACG
jgi:hypothetical protein